ncbi:MAG: nucleotide sugar dehydrogenase [Alphaproteobacteria bacterium]|nr:nucleotide sugar dehydrogenase [Alphaproteobacteria bacterium]
MTANASSSKPAHNRTIAVIGLGYVGLSLAVALARTGARTIGFDIDPERVGECRQGLDRRGEVEAHEFVGTTAEFTHELSALADADFFIVAVPTPIDEARRPNLRPLVRASETVGAIMRPGAIVVYESTVYPGATEEACLPVLERASNLKAGQDFEIGYSPERVNPGDKVHRLETIVKVVSAQSDAALDVIASVYESVVSAGVYRASSIRVAEAAKVIENTQRDVNIALMNELSTILGALGVDTMDVLKTASTKWNFLNFTPGLVGGHCISVDPYYLTHKAETVGLHAEVILAARRMNDSIGARIARECVKLSGKRGAPLRRVTILGLTFKENVPDLRNSKVFDIIEALLDHGVHVQIHDPVAWPQDAEREYSVTLTPLQDLTPADAVIFAVPHAQLIEGGWPLMRSLLPEEGGVIMDVKSVLPREDKPQDVTLWRL